MDPSVLLKSNWRPQWPDPVADRAKLLTLRDLMDQRRIREQQYQIHQLAIQKSQQEMADEQRTRQLLATTPISEKTTLRDLLDKGIPLPAAIKIDTELRLRGTAATQQKTAELTQQKTTADLEAERQKQIANVYAGVTALPPGEYSQRQPAWDEAIMNDLLKPEGQRLGLGQIGVETSPAPTNLQEQAQYARAYGAKELQARQFAAEEEARKNAMHAPQFAKALADANTATLTSEGNQPLTQYQRRELDIRETPNTLAELEIAIANPKLSAEKRKQYEAARPALIEAEKNKRLAPLAPGATGSDAEDIAEAIIRGERKPEVKGLYKTGVAVQAILARKGYNSARAELDWQATNKHLSTLNGQQQERLRQAITFTTDSLDVIDNLYKRWQAVGKVTGFPVLNAANIKIAKQLPGEAGAIATSLDAQINDLTSELGTVYKGGNSSTDESLRLAAENLKSNWNEPQFKQAMDNIRTNLKIRRNSILTSEPVGVTPGSPYTPQAQAKEEATQPRGRIYQKQGINRKTGHIIGSDDGNTWYDVQTGKRVE
jgi:hypothetical protein